MQLQGRGFRWSVYGLLTLVIVAGLALSAFMAAKAESVGQALRPLLSEKLPAYKHLGEFEHAVLLYQLALNKYATRSIDHDRFLQLTAHQRKDIARGLDSLRRDFPDHAGVSPIGAASAGLLPLAGQLDDMLADAAGNPPGARGLLQLANRYANDIHDQLGYLKQGVSTSLLQAQALTHTGIDAMSRLVHAYTLLTLAASLFMMYHVRARLRTEQQLAFQASHDPLTDLANRRSFERRLRAVKDRSHTLVLGMIDRYDRVVGGLGYAYADRLMREIAHRLRAAAERHGGEVFRLDGATLAVLYRGKQDAGGKEMAATPDALEALRAAMRHPFRFGQHEVFPSLSLGSAQHPAQSRDVAQLLTHADAALRAAREAGGDLLVPYSEALGEQTRHTLQREAQLAHALEREELVLYYQPRERLASGELAGFEALLRWRHDGEPISPAEFIPIAEECGLIIPIGAWVLEQACRQARLWQALAPELVVAVNISPRQFAHPDFLRMVARVVAETGVDPARIELEITEGMLMHDHRRGEGLLHALRELGLRLAIDDFGTGYSSLAYLKRFPVDMLKIDQSFIRSLRPDGNDAAIVRAMINMARHLGLRVIAEGVETTAQRGWLRDWGCDEIQGFWYGKPMPAAVAGVYVRSPATVSIPASA
ncbi:putative bifunctional diguanylate cyclase/phosphodiesterase [Achromobacter aloeverae]|uniref:GGDEF-domain containing protein n=1 Tax=Achromobacter aloeverae TaxID=1750518 RepID=A0A4Q1HSM9_9BURK|nr:bifunctional diguanylate cyclase/phosphodiesterase [Achromobacter aloeverae]RXN92945.1 GGDEF-domain containing protein [Achromobacter aloeverae]